jgi:hypothetical protein
MIFYWVTALRSVCIFAIPIALLAGVGFFVEEHPWLAALCTFVFLACVFVLGGLPIE